MKVNVACALISSIALLSCGKDPSPASISTNDQGASVAANSPGSASTQGGPGSSAKGPLSPEKPGTPDGAYCPVVELAGTYTVNSVVCDTDGHPSKVDATAVPTAYTVAARGEASGTLSLTVGSKSLTLTFPRNPDTWLDFQKNGTQCTNGAVKSLTQRCPGSKDSNCEYSFSVRSGKMQGIYDRVTGTHLYECRSDLSLVAPARAP